MLDSKAMTKYVEEIDHVRRLLLTLGYKDFELSPSDRPDVEVMLGRRSVRVGVTVFHADEGPHRQSTSLGAAEERTAKRAGNRSYAPASVRDPFPGLVRRTRDGVRAVESYDRKRFAALWHLIVAQYPNPGAGAEMFPRPAALDLHALSMRFRELLSARTVDRVYLHLFLEQLVYAWTPAGRWQSLNGSALQGG